MIGLNRMDGAPVTAAVTKRGLRPDLTGAVIDRWWPHRVGVVVRRLKTRLHVRWLDGEIWSYDTAHTQFLKLYRIKRVHA